MLKTVIWIRGTVQGVGFRPFVARLARAHQVNGWVRNDQSGVLILAIVENPTMLEAFIQSLRHQAPPAAGIEAIETHESTEENGLECAFHIVESPKASGPVALSVPPDLGICPECLRELEDPADRRKGYPFINCTHCGPRYSIILDLPYDRERTSMRGFKLCPKCEQEYRDPENRRYHAEPIACPQCGPRLTLTEPEGREVSHGDDALRTAAKEIKRGRIVAVKGIGGYHLMVDACNREAVLELRKRKHRDEKPLAVMFPSLTSLKDHCDASETSQRLISSPEAPIVLLSKRKGTPIAEEIAPGNPMLGALLPYSPLHHLLLLEVGGPVVATSGNLSEEPLCHENEEAQRRLSKIADAFLSHDRAIIRPTDDSILRPDGRGGMIPLRRARGYTPVPIVMADGIPEGPPILCLGGHMKNTIAVASGNRAILSPHIGDLSNPASIEAFKSNIDLLCGLLHEQPNQVVCDLHPDYASSMHAERMGIPVTRVQHHVAHLLACLGEQKSLPEQVLGVCWDGTGYGDDGSIWGGEFLLYSGRQKSVQRVGRLRPFRLPGGDAAAREPRRSALALLQEMRGSNTNRKNEAWHEVLGFTHTEHALLLRMMEKGGQLAPHCSSAGRLFDGAAAILGLRQRSSFEGQAAMELEFAALKAEKRGKPSALPFPIEKTETLWEVDWRSAVEKLWLFKQTREPTELAFAFHEGLAQAIATLADKIGADHVALSGGCFQNALLLERTHRAMEQGRIKVLTHHQLPPNDGNLAFGQAVAARLGVMRTL